MYSVKLIRRALYAAAVVLLAAGAARAVLVHDFTTPTTCLGAYTTFTSGGCGSGTCSLLNGGSSMSDITCGGAVMRMGLKNGSGNYYIVETSSGTGVNLSGYDYVAFDVRVSSVEYHSQSFAIKLGDTTSTRLPMARWFPEGLPLAMTNVKIPLTEYYTPAQLGSVKNIAWNWSMPSSGTVSQLFFYVDNVEVLKETTALTVEAASMISSGTVRVYFNVPVGASGGTSTNYSLSPSITVNTAVRDDNNLSVQLQLASALAINTTYTLTVTGVTSQNNGTALGGGQNTATFIGHNKHPFFMDDFNRLDSLLTTETPPGPWVDTAYVAVEQNDNYVAISTVTTLYGGRSLHCADLSPTTYRAYVREIFPSPPTVANFRYYFYLPQRFFNAMPNSGTRRIGQIESSDAAEDFKIIASKSAAGVPQLQITFINSAAATKYSDLVPIAPDTWNSVEIHAENGNPADIFVWLNGQKIYASRAVNFSGVTNWTVFEVGLQTSGNVSYKQDMYIDEVRVSTGSYIGQIEKPTGVMSATVKNKATVWVYLNQAVSADDTAWTNTANYSITPTLTVNSVTIDDDSQAIALHTNTQTNNVRYTVTVNSALLQAGAKNTAPFVGISPTPFMSDDFNRPGGGFPAPGVGTNPANSGFFPPSGAYGYLSSPQGPWDYAWGSTPSNITFSSGTVDPFKGDFALKAYENDTAVGNDYAQLYKYDINASSSAHLRFYVYLPETDFFSPMQTGKSRYIAQLKGSNVACYSSDYCNLTVLVTKTSASLYQIRLMARDAAGTYPVTPLVQISSDTWHAIEIVAPSTGAAVTASIYLDGTNIGDLVSINFSAAGHWDTVQLGPSYYDGTNGIAGTAYYDEVQITTTAANIGIIPCNGPFSASFTDPTLTPGSTLVKTVHILELREGIDFLRTDAGLGTYSWTDPALVSTHTIRAVHVTDLRTALADVYTACGQTAPSYTDPTITPGTTVVRSVHIDELRAAGLAAY